MPAQIVSAAENLFEPKQRAHSSLLAAGLASELKINAIPCCRRFPHSLLRGASIINRLEQICLRLESLYHAQQSVFYLHFNRILSSSTCLVSERIKKMILLNKLSFCNLSVVI